MDMVVGVLSSLWGCLSLNLDIQLCDGILDFIVFQTAVDGGRAWSFMEEPTGVSCEAVGKGVGILWLRCMGIGAFCGDGCV